MKRVKMTGLFLKNNYKKAIPSIITLTTFLLILNILLGVLFSTTGIFSNSIVDNSSVHFMEIINNGDMLDISKIKSFLSSQHEISDSFYDTAHPVIIECNNDDGFELYTMIGMPKNLLPKLGLSTSNEKFCYLPKADKKNFKDITSIQIEETLYPKNGGAKADIEYFEYKISGFFEEIKWDLFPEKVVIVDNITAEKISQRSNTDGNILSDRIISYVPDSALMKDVEQKIVTEFPNVEVRYSLKYTGNLSQFAKVFIAVSGIIVFVLIVFCVINIRESVHQIMNVRKRDIGLLSLFGVENSYISSTFILEFLIYGIASFALSFISTCSLFALINKLFSLNLLGQYVVVYLFVDLFIAVVMFMCISSIQVKKVIKRIDSTKIFKEILN